MVDNQENMINLVESYSNLSIEDKRKEFGKELAELILIVQKLTTDLIEEVSLPSFDSLNNLYSAKLSEDDYLTGVYEDLLSFKETFAIYITEIMKLYYNNNEE